MALGRSAIAYVKQEQEIIRNTCNNELKDRLNTFTYVVNNLHEWASETDVGLELRAKLKKINTDLENLRQSTITLNNRITEFVNTQENINRGK